MSHVSDMQFGIIFSLHLSVSNRYNSRKKIYLDVRKLNHLEDAVDGVGVF